MLIEIILPAGRSRELKKELLMIIVANLHERVGIRAQDVIVLIMETESDNWAYYSGVQYYADRAEGMVCRQPGSTLHVDTLTIDFKE